MAIRPALACDAGYYLDSNNECKNCLGNISAPYYCPGDDLRHSCPSIGKTPEESNQWAYTNYGLTRNNIGGAGYWNGNSTSPQGCTFYAPMQNEVASDIYFTIVYDEISETYSRNVNILYRQARQGYYLKNPTDSGNRYFRSYGTCTNAPTNAHYTGAGTNDTYTRTIIDANDCPWACDDGYYQNDNNECRTCISGYYYTNGITNTCPTGYSNSIICASTDTECYTTCTTANIAHSTTVTGNDYYGTGNDTCAATACENGYHINDSGICVGNVFHVIWQEADPADISANNADTWVYGEDIRTPLKAPELPGKRFKGWRLTTNIQQ